MDTRLLRFKLYSVTPNQVQSTVNLSQLHRQQDRSPASLLKYKNEPMRKFLPTKQIDQIPLERPTTQNHLVPIRLSYSNSIKYIEQFPEQQLDEKALKLLHPSYLQSGCSTRRLRNQLTAKQEHRHTSQRSEDAQASTSQYRFAQQAVKSQFKANLLYFKKSQNIPAQVQLLQHERTYRRFQTTLPTFVQRIEAGQNLNFDTCRDGYLKSQKSNLYPKTKPHVSHSALQKKSSSAQTQLRLDELGKEVTRSQFNNELYSQ